MGTEARLAGPGSWPHPYCSTAPLEVWCVQGVAEREVVVKRPTHRTIRPPFVLEPDRERAVYGMILELRDVGAPRLLGTISEPGADADALVLESVDGDPLWQFEDELVWREAATWLGGFHARYWDPPDSLVQNALLLVLDEAHHRRWIRRALEGVRAGSSADADRKARSTAEWLAARWDAVVERMRAVPRSLLHGEFYPSNILVRRGKRPGSRICALDWESAGVGPCLIDLAALTTGWDSDARARMAADYLAVAGADGRWSPDPSHFDEQLDACRVQQAVQWCAWTSQWTPPPEHVRDWWGDAVEIVEARGW